MTSSRPGELPPDAILVHIGPHKTGTTSIQSTLARSRAQLREHGVHYPGRRMAHHPEAKSLRQQSQGWAHDGKPPPDPSVWTDLAKHVASLDGRVVISSEFFAEADAAQRARLVRDLGADRVHIVAGARNRASIVVSSWQQLIRSLGRTASLERWLEKNYRRADAPERPTEFLWRANPAALVEHWSDVVPAERITVVVLDERDHRLLPASFEAMLGLPGGLLADQRPPQANRGLSAVEIEMIRQINAELHNRIRWADYDLTMRRGVIQRLIEVRSPAPEEGKPQLPGWAVDRAVAEAEQNVARLQRCGARIIGDPESLRVVPATGPDERPITDVPIDLAVQAVVGAIAAGTRGKWSLRPPRKPEQVPNGRPAPGRRPGTTHPARPRMNTVPSRELVAILGRRVRRGLRRRLRELRRR